MMAPLDDSDELDLAKNQKSHPDFDLNKYLKEEAQQEEQNQEANKRLHKFIPILHEKINKILSFYTIMNTYVNKLLSLEYLLINDKNNREKLLGDKKKFNLLNLALSKKKIS